jgi:hypothetical protein
MCFELLPIGVLQLRSMFLAFDSHHGDPSYAQDAQYGPLVEAQVMPKP